MHFLQSFFETICIVKKKKNPIQINVNRIELNITWNRYHFLLATDSATALGHPLTLQVCHKNKSFSTLVKDSETDWLIVIGDKALKENLIYSCCSNPISLCSSLNKWRCLLMKRERFMSLQSVELLMHESHIIVLSFTSHAELHMADSKKVCNAKQDA